MTEPAGLVYVVDDDAGVRATIETLLSSVEIEYELYDNAERFLEMFDSQRPCCLLLDVRMPGVSGLELQRLLRQREFHMPVIIMSGHGDVQVAARAFRDGAVDFIEKPFSAQFLLERVQDALLRARRIFAGLQERRQVEVRLRRLTPREAAVLDLVVAGFSNKEIAHALKLSSKTVEVHRSHVMQKMEAGSLADLVRQVVTVRLHDRSAPVGAPLPAGPGIVPVSGASATDTSA